MSLANRYKIINTLSLDVALGAVACAMAFASYFKADVRAAAWFALGLTVWIIYTLDHLYDAFKLKATAITVRHRFHVQHKRLLLIITSVAVIADVMLLFKIRTEVLQSGLLLAACVAVYLLLNHIGSVVKEFAAAALYTSGVLLPAVIVAHVIWNPVHVLVIVQFFCVVIINLLTFAYFDYESDAATTQRSFAVRFGKLNTVRWITVFCIVQFIAGILSVFSNEWILPILFAFMTAAIFLMIRYQQWFGVNDRFRFLGDAAFYLPIISLWLR